MKKRLDLSARRFRIRSIHTVSGTELTRSVVTCAKWNANKAKDCHRWLKDSLGLMTQDKRKEQTQRREEGNSWSFDCHSWREIKIQTWPALVRRNEATEWCSFRCKAWTACLAGSTSEGRWCRHIRCFRCKACNWIRIKTLEESSHHKLELNFLYSIFTLYFRIMQKSEPLNELMESIWKDMCHLEFLYPNAWKWTIQDKWGWEHRAETLFECFTAFKEQRRKQKQREKSLWIS